MNKKRVSRLFQNIILAILVAYLGFYFYTKFSGVNDGEMAPDFEAELIDGTPFKLSDLRGKYVLIDFWGSWCGPCRKENPKLVSFYQAHRENLEIVTVALEKGGERWKKVSEKDGFDWKYQIVEFHKAVMLSNIARAYGVSEIPAKFLVDPEGRIMKGLSFDEMEALLE